MAETFNDGEARSSIRAKYNRVANGLDTAQQTIITLSNQISALTSRVVTLESSEGGTGGEVVTSDGALTSESYFHIDTFAYSYQVTGSSGQSFGKENTVPGYNGSGYAYLNAVTAVDGTNAIAYLNGFATNSSDPKVQVDRKIWLRVYGGSGATIAGRSHGNGTIGTATLNQSQAWHWVKLSTNHVAYDNQYQLHGRSGSVLIDSIILTTLANTTTPTGKDGYRSS